MIRMIGLRHFPRKALHMARNTQAAPPATKPQDIIEAAGHPVGSGNMKPHYDENLANEDLAPLRKQKWSWYNIFAFWMSDVHSVGGYVTAGSLFALGIAAWQVLVALLVGIIIALVFRGIFIALGAVAILAAGAGAYTVYGGLLSAVWADLVQYILLMAAGLAVLLVGLWHVGGLQTMVAEMPEKFLMFYPPTHEMIPFTGVVFGLFSVGLWYSCANQFMVQRCLGARSEWDARMGVVMAGFSKALLPFLVVIPGMIAFYVFQDRINDGDQSWPFLVRQWLPPGLVGLVLAGLASAILSTLSAISSSSATIFTLDLYKELVRPDAKDRELHLVGRVSTAAAMVIGVVIALVLARFPGFTVFQVIQQVFFYIAGPIAAIFLVGILWRRATPAATVRGAKPSSPSVWRSPQRWPEQRRSSPFRRRHRGRSTAAARPRSADRLRPRRPSTTRPTRPQRRSDRREASGCKRRPAR